MKLTPMFLDFESFWDTDHTLTKMSPTEYVMSPKTEIISLSIKAKDYPTDVFFGEDAIRKALHSISWDDKMAIGHNMSGFDSMILKWRFGVQPKMWGCTAAMARSKYAKTCGVSLAKLVQEFGFGEKNAAILHNTKGKRLADFTDAELRAMAHYNRMDTEQCAMLFTRLAKGFPRSELLLIHLTTQMLVNPQFELDTAMVETALSVERSDKHKALLELAKLLRIDAEAPGALDWSDEAVVAEFVRSEMASAARFSKLLESCGVEVPMKPSPTNPDRMTPALAKTDEAFLKLQDHPSPLVAMAARTRLSVKSTLLETRLEAFLRAGAACGGKLPVPLKYAGADTTGRWSGEQYNMQNLPRINPKSPKTSDALRNSLKAPKGYKVVVADLSGIELRVNHFLWQVQQSMDLYAEDAEADLYRAFAAARYGIEPEEVTKDQRQLAKVAQLGLGFGAGAATFQKVAKLMGGLELSADEAKEVVDSWRATYHDIVSGWRKFHDSLPNILQGVERPIDPWGLCVSEHKAVRLPSGRRIYYPDLRQERDEKGKVEWWYGQGRHKARIYAGKGVENCIAEGTLVLTDSGWKPIEQVALEDRVHDGVEFVRHAGTVFKSVQGCITLDGVYMTPDHKVLTDDGWQEASQVQRPYRPDIRGVPHPALVEPGRTGSHAVSRKPVYDIINCGPRHRFVVKGESGPMVVHNCVQALARDVMADISVRLYKLYKFEPCLLVHDEYVMILPEREAESGLRVINDEMRKPPKWWPELILHSEGDIGDSYGQCK